MRIEPLTLRLPSDAEQAFLHDRFQRSLPLIRLGALSMAVAALLYVVAMGGVLSGVGADALRTGAGVVAAALIGACVLSFGGAFERVARPLLSALALAFLAVFVGAAAQVRGASELTAAVVVGLLAGALCAFHLLRIGFVPAALVTTVATGAWAVGALASGAASWLLVLVVVDAAFLVGVTGYVTERYVRRDFVNTELLRRERLKSEQLLLNVLPAPIAERLKAGKEPLADGFPEATVLFADIVGFTEISAKLEPDAVVAMLNDLFSELDRLAARHGLEKIKTVGDAYMVVGGVPEPRPDHAEAVAEMALDIQRAMAGRVAPTGDPLRVRVGVNTGPVVAGVIGLAKFIYDLWGDTVNTASRMESHGVPGAIQVTQETYTRLKDRYRFEARGEVDLKGKGPTQAYILVGPA